MQHYRSRDKMEAWLSVPSDNTDFKRARLHGYVDFTDNTTDPTTSTVTMRATMPNPDTAILPGTFVYVDVFVTDKIPFIMLPPQVVFEDQQGKFVYTVGDNGKAQRTGVKVGLSSRYYVQIDEGLEPGQRVVVSGLMKVRAGMKLAPTDVTDTQGVFAVLKRNRLLPEAQ